MQLVKALANPTRIRILEAIAQGPATAREVAELLDENLGVVTYHARVLRTAGCIEFTEDEGVGGAAERTYELAPEATPTQQLAPLPPPRPGYAHPPAAIVRSVLASKTYNPIAGPFGRGRDQLSCASFVVDQQGWGEISVAIHEAMERISVALEQSARRLSDSEEEAINATIAVASFESSRAA